MSEYTSHPLLSESQKGFIKGVDGCLEHSRTASELFCDANRKGKNIYATAIDFRDAFGSIPHDLIHYTLRSMRFPDSLCEIIKNSYESAYTNVRVGNVVSRPIRIGKGVKQGCPASPLIFNLSLNPLLEALNKHGKGYVVGDSSVTVQAYADDVILFAETRSGMIRNLQIVEQYLGYSKLEVNSSKCHSVSYILNEENHRDFDKTPFTICGDEIKMSTLAEGIKYLGVTTAATNSIRVHGTEDVINNVKRLLDNINASPLRLNQKLYAIKTFAVPMLDYVLTEGVVTLNAMKEVDKCIRKVVRMHVKANLPLPVYYTHWKDGGLGLTTLYERAKALRIKAFMAMYNSKNFMTRSLMRDFVESERKHRGVNRSKNEEDCDFLDWTNTQSKRRGTDCLAIKAMEAAQYFKIKLTLINDRLVADLSNMTENNEQEEQNDVDSSKEITRLLMKMKKEEHQSELVHNLKTGHSFRNISNSPYANIFIGNFKVALNDNIASWAIKARCNMLLTGSRCVAFNKPFNINCPYCLTHNNDSISHRLNSCKCNQNDKKKRHNMVQNVIIRAASKRFKDSHITTDHGVNVDNEQIDAPFNKLRPDIVIWNDKHIHIIEITCPYDSVSEKGVDLLDERYNEKVSKYKDLIAKCNSQYKRETDLTTVVVSSLGAIHKKSIKEIGKLLGCSSGKNPKKLKNLCKRLSLSALIGSYFIFYKIPFSEKHKHKGTEDSTYSSANSSQNEVNSDTNDEEEELSSEDDCSDIELYENSNFNKREHRFNISDFEEEESEIE